MSTPVVPNAQPDDRGSGRPSNKPDKRASARANDKTSDRGASPVATATDQRRDVISRQKEQFGGMKFGCSFFGWLTATGTAVLLTGLLAAIGAATGLTKGVDPAQPAAAQTAGLVGAIVAGVVVLVAYFCGGYVAARMARFSGIKQGLGVWLWALIAAAVITVLALVLGNRIDVMASLNQVIPISVSKNMLTAGGIITAVAFLVVSLIGALLGGLAGMRFHRRVDRAGFDHVV